MSAVTYLQLAPEFGGTKYGPFRGSEIRLGSDPAMNDISLPADNGVLPQHVKILQQSETSYIIAPVDRTATVFVWRANSNKPKQITTPMAVQAEDGFSLVTPEGFRFYIVNEVVKKDRNKTNDAFADKAMKNMPTSRGIFEEVKRRGFAKVFTTKLGNSAMYGYRFIATGQIFSPVYMVAGIMMLSGTLFAGGSTCAAFSLNSQKNQVASALQQCEDQRDGTENTGEAGPSVGSLTQKILSSNDWSSTLRDDKGLYESFTKELRGAFGSPQKYKIHYTRKGTPLTQMRAAMGNDGLANSIAFAAAQPTNTTNRSWRVVQDSEGKLVCGRGPLALTYRQAKNLNLDVQVDALVKRSVAESLDPTEHEAALRETAEAALDEDFTMAGRRIVKPGSASISGAEECMHVEGEDDRDDPAKLARMLRNQLGGNAKGVPGDGQATWLSKRLVKLAAADFTNYNDDVLDLNHTRPTIQDLETNEPSTARVEFAKKVAGRTMAWAVVTRCMAVLDQDLDQPPEHLGKLPTLVDCAVIKAFVDYQKL